jgi:hypothetical protein
MELGDFSSQSLVSKWLRGKVLTTLELEPFPEALLRHALKTKDLQLTRSFKVLITLKLDPVGEDGQWL